MRDETVPVSYLAADDQVTVRLAASVILLRDTTDGVETLLLERPHTAVFAPGALVFPGGKVDPNDASITALRTETVPLAQWQQRLNVESAGVARAVLAAAIRETYEESGVLLVCDRDGTPVDAARAQHPTFRELRDLQPSVAAQRWRELLRRERLYMDTDRLTLMSWWVTPSGYPRRYDTRFFLATLPQGAHVSPAPGEVVSALWLPPATAVRDAHRGTRNIIYPTRKNLEDLAGYTTTGAAHAAWQQHADAIRRLQPKRVIVNGRVMAQHPDGGEPEAE